MLEATFMHQRFLAAVALIAAGVGLAQAADPGAKTTVDGQVFADLSDINQQQNGTDVAPTGVGFDIKRAYLIVNHTFDNTWSANLTTEAQYISSTSGTGYSSSTSSNSGGVTEVFIKLLYLQARVNDAFVVHAGSYNSPWYGYVVNLYGYRYIERLLTERLGLGYSADWGLNASGIAGGNGIFNYSISAVDGGGYKNPTRTRDVDVEAAVLIKPVGWLNLGAGAYTGHLGQMTQTTAQYASHTATRLDLVAAVVTNKLRVGAEYLVARNFKAANPSTGVLSGPGGVVVATNVTATDPTGTVVSDEAEGYSAWASYEFLPRWRVFARNDDVRLSKHYDPKLRDLYFDAGVSYEPIRNIDLALVYKHEKVTNGTISVSSGDGNSSYTIGGTAAPGTGIRTSGQFNEVGVYTQYTF